jgi:hypothetical protein
MCVLRALMSSIGVALFFSASVGCSDASPLPGEVDGRTEGIASFAESAPVEACTEGLARECVIPKPSHAGVPNCAHGVQECGDAGWTTCHAPNADAGTDAMPSELFVPESDSNP